MREIKFRGKRVDTGEWVYGDVQRNFDGRCFIGEIIFEGSGDSLNINGFGSVEVIPETIGQYIGLEDESGIEIYEGDVVAFEDLSHTESGYYEQNCTGEVLWDTETASFQVTERISAESYEVLEECFIIGNIHDNEKLEENI